MPKISRPIYPVKLLCIYLYQKIHDEQRHQEVDHCRHPRRDDN